MATLRTVGHPIDGLAVSTKSTIAYGPDFHLYHEMMEDDAVYLQIEGQEFKATPDKVTLKIPVAVWEHIRQFKGFHPDYHLLDDQQILDTATQAVEHRIQRYLEADERHRGWITLEGFMIYGEATATADQQVRDGVEFMTKKRNHERAILAQIEALNKPEKSDGLI